MLSGIVDDRVNQLLNSEENRTLLDGLDKATQRVELAKQELAQIEKQEIENQKIKEYINQLESRASEVNFFVSPIYIFRIFVPSSYYRCMFRTLNSD